MNQRIAAIDLGTNSFHLVIVELKNIDQLSSIDEIETKGNFEVLYRQREVVRINVGSGNKENVLTPEGIERAINVLSKFKQKIDEYGAITHAVATSAIREAQNKNEFLEYVKNNLGISIQVVSGFEEARLIYLGVLQGLNIYDKQILLIDIGGGSTELLLGKRGKVLYASSLKLGAVRLAQKFFDGGKDLSSEKKYECKRYIKELLNNNLKPFKKIGFELVIGTSGEIQAIARMIYLKDTEIEKEEYKTFHGVDFTYEQFKKVSDKIFKAKSLEELKLIPTLDDKRADIIVPGTLILKIILNKLKIDRVTVSAYALREGIILDAIEKYYKKELIINSEQYKVYSDKDIRIKSVMNLALAYNVDFTHSNQVKKIALKIFDEFKEIHKLNDYERELLEYAAILHDIGYYISPIKHHKHSYFIIKNSELIGFSEKEIDLIANIARYHRKAKPKTTHKNLINFSNEEFNLIRILSAILRMADGLEKTHSAVINDIKLFNNNGIDNYILVLRYLTHPPEAEYWAAQKRKQVIEEIFNIKLELRLERITLLNG
ncbi:MAG: Ppx/GppA family phosphatase [Candidatus Omnitrophica bacterium]|nr:Ppx/GppA family phosphatase [Candidatus Omnitrophota bacterium]